MRKKLTSGALAVMLLGALACTDEADPLAPSDAARAEEPVGGFGNNLSFPVLWAEGVTKALQGTFGTTVLNGEYWYQWGTNGVDPDVVPASCAPDPDEGDALLNPNALPLCDDGTVGSVDLNMLAGLPAADNPLPLARAYLQKDPGNVWQAASLDVSSAPLHVNWIDWGDNLESGDWYTRSQVRTEVVLFQDLTTPMVEFEMRHTSGWGIDEVHGAAASLNPVGALNGPGTQATIYSPCARFTIQKLLIAREAVVAGSLTWVPGTGWTETDPTTSLINDAIFNKAVHEGGDGPGYYAAEINVKGRIIYGYTWNVRTLNDDTPVDGSSAPTAAGDYRMTFSLDQTCGTATLNTFLDLAQIILPLEEEEVTIEAEPVGGGAAVLIPDLNLTYIDVRILARAGGGGGGGGKGGGGGGGKGGPGA